MKPAYAKALFLRKVSFTDLPKNKKPWGLIPRWLIFSFLLFTMPLYAGQTASWYGGVGDTCDPFPHIMTASGRPYDENSFTCASWLFPFGTYLRVTNLENGKVVTVVVVDRGPVKRLVKKGRVIDLSKRAFAEIADLKQGIIPIAIEVVKRGGERND